jgi:polyferredoxin
MGREVENGQIENVYRLQIMNTDESRHHYHIGVEGIEGITLQGTGEVTLGSTESRSVPVDVRVPEGKGSKGSNKIWFTLIDTDHPEVSLREKAVFFVPR